MHGITARVSVDIYFPGCLPTKEAVLYGVKRTKQMKIIKPENHIQLTGISNDVNVHILYVFPNACAAYLRVHAREEFVKTCHNSL